MSIPNFTLSNGFKIPYVGLGTYKEENPEVLIKAIKAAVAAGYRHFDCAYCYNNEHIVGQALRECIEESNGALKREDLFITSKCWNTFHSKKAVAEHIDSCLKKFGFDYLDLFIMHWPMGFKENAGDFPVDENGKVLFSDVHFTETYEALELLHSQGKAKSIGLSNFNIEQVKVILGMCKVRPVCNQFEVNPLLQNKELVDYCLSENIAVVGFAPLGAADRSWAVTGDPMPLENPVILDMAKKYNKTPAQVILRWLYQRNIIVIPKSVTPARIVQNIQIFDFELSAEDMDAFKTKFPKEFRFYLFDVSQDHPDYPFKK